MRVGYGAPLVVISLCGCSALIALDHYRQCDGSDECARVVDGGPMMPADTGPPPITCDATTPCPSSKPVCSSKGTCLGIVALGHGSSNHACAILDDHSLWCWGDNQNGVVGSGPMGPISKPRRVDFGSDNDPVIGVSLGNTATCALMARGAVYCWGSANAGGQTPTPTSTVDLGADRAVQISVGPNDACAALKGGGVKCWGQNNNGIIGCEADGGCDHPSALPSSPRSLPTLGAMYDRVASGPATCAQVNGSGNIRCWGDDAAGAFGDGMTFPMNQCCGFTKVDTVVSAKYPLDELAPTELYTCARDNNAVWRCWGDSDSRGCAIHDFSGPLCGAVPSPVVISLGTSKVLRLAPGWLHMCAVTGNGESPTDIFCWGQNDHGQAGAKAKSPPRVDTPVHIDSLVGPIAEIAAHRQFTCALMVDGRLLCWGQGDRGQLGNGQLIDSNVPIEVVWQ